MHCDPPSEADTQRWTPAFATPREHQLNDSAGLRNTWGSVLFCCFIQFCFQVKKNVINLFWKGLLLNVHPLQEVKLSELSGSLQFLKLCIIF
jgi:hypothetical protein